MASTKFYNPKSLTEALDLLDAFREKAVVVNGGTDIVAQIADGKVSPEAIIYIQNVDELRDIRSGGGFVCIGGAATYARVLASPDCKQFSAMIEAISQCGSPPIRAVGTPAGNIGTAAPAADCNVALVALGAEIVLASKGGERVVPAAEMFVGAWATQRKPGELIKEIRIPDMVNGAGSGFIKLAKRKAQDIAQVSAAVCLLAEGSVIKDICVALGAVAPKTVRAQSFEALAKGKAAQQAAESVKNVIPNEALLRNPRNKPYKEAVMGVAAARAITQAFADSERGN